MTYVKIEDGRIVGVDDGFCAGTGGQHWVETDEGLKEHIEDCWANVDGVYIFDKKSKKAKYCRDQWKKLRAEYKKNGKLKDGCRIGWFDLNSDRLLDCIKNFETELKKVGYAITDNIADCIEAVKEK